MSQEREERKACHSPKCEHASTGQCAVCLEWFCDAHDEEHDCLGSFNCHHDDVKRSLSLMVLSHYNAFDVLEKETAALRAELAEKTAEVERERKEAIATRERWMSTTKAAVELKNKYRQQLAAEQAGRKEAEKKRDELQEILDDLKSDWDDRRLMD